jgi:hypothetical protein
MGSFQQKSALVHENVNNCSLLHQHKAHGSGHFSKTKVNGVNKKEIVFELFVGTCIKSKL